MGTMGPYADLAGAYTFIIAVGVAFVMSPLAQVEAYMNATTDFETSPMLFYTLDTSPFNTSVTHDPNSQVSWGALQQILNDFTSCIPQDLGTFVDWHAVNITEEMSGSHNVSAPEAAGPSN